MTARWLLLTTDFRPMRGGIARLLGSIVDLSPGDIEWRCLTLAPGGPEAGVFRYRSFAGLCRSLPVHGRWIRAGSERQVVCGHAYVQPAALGLAKMSGARLTTLVYGTEIVPMRAAHWGALSLLRFSHGVIADSRYAADAAASGAGVSSRRLSVVLPEFRSPYLRAGPPGPRGRGERLRLVTISRLADVHKNLEVGIRAVSVLAGTDLIERYTIVGDGPQRPALEDLARRLAVDHLVEFVGSLADDAAAAVLAAAHVALFPSRRVANYFEGFGMVVHELAGAGLPVLVGDSGGTSEASSGDWCMLLDPEDLAAWVFRLEQLGRDEAARFRLAQQAHRWASGIDPAETVRRYVDAVRGRPTTD